MANINIVPFVDIILVILIVFMVTSPFVVKPARGLNVPVASKAGQILPEMLLRVELLTTGELFLNKNKVPFVEFKQRAQAWLHRVQQQQQGASIKALVAADSEASHGHVVSLIEALKSLGVHNVAIAVQ